MSLYTHKAAASTLKNSLKRRLKELFCSRMTCILSDFFQAPAEQLRSNFGQTVDENHHCTVVYFWYTKRQKKHNTMKSWPATVTIEVTKLLHCICSIRSIENYNWHWFLSILDLVKNIKFDSYLQTHFSLPLLNKTFNKFWNGFWSNFHFDYHSCDFLWPIKT